MLRYSIDENNKGMTCYGAPTLPHADSHLPKDNNARRLLFAFITAGFMLLRWWRIPPSGVVGGCGHMLTDAAAPSSLRCWRFTFPSSPRPFASHTFGWLRPHHLAAFVNAIALVVITLLIVCQR